MQSNKQETYISNRDIEYIDIYNKKLFKELQRYQDIFIYIYIYIYIHRIYIYITYEDQQLIISVNVVEQTFTLTGVTLGKANEHKDKIERCCISIK